MTVNEVTREEALRQRAIRRLKKKRDFHTHVLVYILVNAFLVAIWMVSDVNGYFWPIFPIVGWGIGVVMNGWDVYHNEEFDEDQIRREVQRMQAHK